MSSVVLEIATRRYGIAQSDLKSLSGGHVSDVHEFARDGLELVLRITPPNQEIDLPSTNAILSWMDYLARHGAAVTRPMPSRDGNLIEMIPVDSDYYLCVVYEKAQGVLAETISNEQWNGQLFESLGQAIGRLHALARSYKPVDASLTRPAWDQISNCFNPGGGLDPSQAAILERKTEIMQLIQALPRHTEDYGLIHADLHLGNFMVDLTDNTVTILDFDDCCYGWYVMDIAMILFDMLVVYPVVDKASFAGQILADCLKGYREEMELSTFSLENLPHFLKLLEIGVYTQVYRSYSAGQADAWVEKFMAGRKDRIEQDVPYVELDIGKYAN
jgi:Ser/Thr protein kinase RdoA (MazF antagonist)